MGHRPVEDVGEHHVGTAHIHAVVVVAITDAQFIANQGHDPRDLGQGAQGRHIVQRDNPLGRPRVGRRAIEEDDVGAEGPHLSHDLALAAFAHGQHDHHRRHTDDNAQQGQRRAKAVDPHDPPGGLDGIHQFAFPGTAVGAAFVEASAQVFGVQGIGVGRGSKRFLAVGAVADNQPVAHFNDAIGPGRHVPVVGDEDHHMALAGQLVEQGHDFGAAVAVQRTGGFIGQDDMPAVHQRPGD
ncbi:hypothetical protein D9M71_51070 [compost metagenome]